MEQEQPDIIWLTFFHLMKVSTQQHWVYYNLPTAISP